MAPRPHACLRLYGLFTRGAFFLGGAVEQTLTDRLVATGALGQAWATDGDALADEIGLRTSRTDLSGSLVWIASPQLMLFASGARTISDTRRRRHAVCDLVRRVDEPVSTGSAAAGQETMTQRVQNY